MHLYDSTVPSGNAYKVQLMLSILKIEYETTSLDIRAKPSESHTPEYLKLNPAGKVPVIVLDDGTPLPESNAILHYLAEGTAFLPEDKLARAQVLRWMFWEQDSHKPFVAKARFHTYWGNFDAPGVGGKQFMMEKGQAAINIMEKHLEGREWLVGERVSIADICLYAYTQTAETVGFSVGRNVKAWLARVEGIGGWVRIKKDPTGKCPL